MYKICYIYEGIFIYEPTNYFFFTNFLGHDLEIFSESKYSFNIYDDKSLFDNDNDDNSSIKSVPEITCNILSKLFAETSYHQTIGNKSIFLLFAQHLSNTFVPYTRMIDDWICKGVL